jgi:hypothetical protein
MKILRFLRSLKDNELVRATLTVASLGLVVKVVALVKEMVVAAHFGVSREMDIFTLAVSVVSLPVSLIAGKGTAQCNVAPIAAGNDDPGLADRPAGAFLDTTYGACLVFG